MWNSRASTVRVMGALEISLRSLDTLVEEVSEDAQVISVHLESGCIGLDSSDLGGGLRMAARLERHVKFVEVRAVVLIHEQVGKFLRPEARDLIEPQVRPFPQVAHDRSQHGHLLGGGPAVNLDAGEEPAGDRLDEGGSECWHGVRPGGRASCAL